MIAINGPMMGKNYVTPKQTTKVIDHVRDVNMAIFELTYYRTKNGWAFHSWRNLYS
jgi:hypothetical protein